MEISTLLAFAAAFFVFAASPGPDNMTIVARTISNGAASGIAYGAGTVVGILIFLTLAAFGLSILAAEMGVVMTILRYAGAAYLVWMGIKLWTAEPVVPEPATRFRTARPTGGLRDGRSSQSRQPENAAVLCGAAAERGRIVADPGHLAALAAVILAVEAVVIGGHVILAGRARKLLRTPIVVRRVNRAAGGVMVGAGVAVVAAR